MRYSIIFASLAAVAVAAPMEMKDMKTTNAMDTANMMGTAGLSFL